MLIIRYATKFLSFLSCYVTRTTVFFSTFKNVCHNDHATVLIKTCHNYYSFYSMHYLIARWHVVLCCLLVLCVFIVCGYIYIFFFFCIPLLMYLLIIFPIGANQQDVSSNYTQFRYTQYLTSEFWLTDQVVVT